MYGNGIVQIQQMVVVPHYASVYIHQLLLHVMIHQASSHSFKIVYYTSFYTSCTLQGLIQKALFSTTVHLSLSCFPPHFYLPTMANNLLIKVQHRGTNCPNSSMILSVQCVGSHPCDRGYYSQIGVSIKPARPMNGSFNLFC